MPDDHERLIDDTREPSRRLLGAVLAVILLVAAGCRGIGSTGPGASPTPLDGGGINFAKDDWTTDFSKHSVPLSEISSGGPPRDGIPPIDHPKLISIAEAGQWLRPNEPVISFSQGDEHRAYPLQVLIWHEITNDQVGGVPITVTFCPLCNSAVAFDRRAAGQVLDFGTTGNLRKSDLVMWDRQTQSWWQQLSGDAIVGALTGTHLRILPASIVSFDTFRRSFPKGQVLSKDTGFARHYGQNPYIGYDQAGQPPFLFNGKLDPRLQPKERVVTVSLNRQDVAYPFTAISKKHVVRDSVGGQPIVVFFQSGTVSALDQPAIPFSRDVGATGVFLPQANGRNLTFSYQNGAFIDAETGSQWNVLGQAVSGPLTGSALAPVVHSDTFWFAWAAFKPDTRIYKAR